MNRYLNVYIFTLNHIIFGMILRDMQRNKKEFHNINKYSRPFFHILLNQILSCENAYSSPLSVNPSVSNSSYPACPSWFETAISLNF